MEIVFITFEPGIRARLRNDSDERNPDGTTFDGVSTVRVTQLPFLLTRTCPRCTVRCRKVGI